MARQSRHGWHVSTRMATQSWTGTARLGRFGKARLGWRGESVMARRGQSRYGCARRGSQGMIGMARLVAASQGNAVEVWRCREVMVGGVSQGEAVYARRGRVGQDKARQSWYGHAAPGMARRGKE